MSGWRINVICNHEVLNVDGHPVTVISRGGDDIIQIVIISVCVGDGSS